MIVKKKTTNGLPSFVLEPENTEDRDFLSYFVDVNNQRDHRIWLESYGQALGACGPDFIRIGWMSEEKLLAARRTDKTGKVKSKKPKGKKPPSFSHYFVDAKDIEVNEDAMVLVLTVADDFEIINFVCSGKTAAIVLKGQKENGAPGP